MNYKFLILTGITIFTSAYLVDYAFGIDTFLNDCKEIQISHSFEKNSTVTFCHDPEAPGLKGIINATVTDALTVHVPRTILDSYETNCDPSTTELVKFYGRNDDFTIIPNEIINQTHRSITIDVESNMTSFWWYGFAFPSTPSLFDVCGAYNGYLTYYAPPKAQLDNGVEPRLIQCNNGLSLIFKPTEFTKPACVTDDTHNKLSKMGWSVALSEDKHQD